MNNKYRLNIISIIIALLISSVITVFVYSIGNKDNIRLQSFNQKIHLNHTHFVQTMKERFEYFLTTYQNEIQQLNLKINHELKFQPNTKFTAGDFNIGVDEIIINQFIKEFYNIFKTDFFVLEFNKDPHRYFVEFSEHYNRIYETGTELSNFLANQKLKLIPYAGNNDFKNFIKNTVIVDIYFETDDYESLQKIYLENRIVSLYVERYLLNEFYNLNKDFLINYIATNTKDIKSTIQIYKSLRKIKPNADVASDESNVDSIIDIEKIYSMLDKIEDNFKQSILNKNVLINDNFYPITMRLEAPSVLIRWTTFSLPSYILFFLFNIFIVYFIALFFLKKKLMKINEN